jgi:hypothetical protein
MVIRIAMGMQLKFIPADNLTVIQYIIDSEG